jgi:hypothetical protein
MSLVESSKLVAHYFQVSHKSDVELFVRASKANVSQGPGPNDIGIE